MSDDTRNAQRTAANLAVAHRYATAWLAGDLAAILACYHEGFTLHYGGANPFSGVHAGRAAALTTLAAVSARTARQLVAIVDVTAGPERAIVIARERFTRNDTTALLDRALVYAIKDDLLHECWLFEFDQATVDRFLAA